MQIFGSLLLECFLIKPCEKAEHMNLFVQTDRRRWQSLQSDKIELCTSKKQSTLGSKGNFFQSIIRIQSFFN